MKLRLKDYILFVFVVLGLFQLFQIIGNISFDKTEKIITAEIETSNHLYQLGKKWGEANAQYVIDNEIPVDDVDDLALEYLYNPEMDITCDYAPGSDGDGECTEFPDLNNLNHKYNVYDHKTTNLALYAFTSGFFDGFNLYIEDNQ